MTQDSRMDVSPSWQQLHDEVERLRPLVDLYAASLKKAEAGRDALAAQLQEQLNDCINFNGGKLTDGVMERSSQLLKGEAGDALARLKAEWEKEAVTAFAHEIWNQLLAKQRTHKVLPLTLAGRWLAERHQAKEDS